MLLWAHPAALSQKSGKLLDTACRGAAKASALSPRPLSSYLPSAALPTVGRGSWAALLREHEHDIFLKITSLGQVRRGQRGFRTDPHLSWRGGQPQRAPLLTTGMAGWRPEEVLSLQTRAALEKDEQTQNPHLPPLSASSRQQEAKMSRIQPNKHQRHEPKCFLSPGHSPSHPILRGVKGSQASGGKLPTGGLSKGRGSSVPVREREAEGRTGTPGGGDSPGLNTPVRNHCPTLCVSHSAGFHSTLDNEETE